MNVFTFSGNLGQDAECRFTPDGKPVVSFSVASNSGYGDKQKTTWIRCNAWGERWVKIADYLRKGKKVTVSGEFSQREWQDQQGGTKYSCEVRVNDLDLPPRSDQDERNAPEYVNHKPPASGQSDFSMYDDSIPF